MKCTGCGADLPENETICPYCDTKVVPDREQQSIEPLESSKKPKLGEKIKNAIRASWKKKDLFSKICTVIALFIAILTIVALISKNRGAIILSILQIAALIIAAVLNKEAKDNQKKWGKYVILGVALLLSVANFACYNGNKRPKTSVPEPVVQSETKACTPCSAKDCIGKTKQEIRNIFLQAGFDNIDEEEIADLDSKELDKDGYVDSVSVNGISNFAGNEEYLSTSRVVINYHSFKRVVVPINSERAKTTATEELKKLFSDAGFFNITQKEKVDLDPDITSAEFENTVSINGESEFNDKANFPVDAEIKIVTHKPYEKYTLKIIVDFVQNLLFSKYDVEMNVDGEFTKLNHGEDGEFEYRLKPGNYPIEFTSTESSSVKGTTEIELTGDTEASYKISCYNDKITVETMYIENGSAVGENEAMIPMAADDCKNKNYQEIEKAFKNAGFTNISLDIVYDISFGITEEGSVKEVTVDGEADFKRGEITEKGKLVVITYHMKAADNPEKQEIESDEKTKEADNKPVYYSTNNQETVTEGNSGVYSYYKKGTEYNIYWIIDFDEGYVYYFLDNVDSCMRAKMTVGDLNNVLIVTYQDGDDIWQEGFHFKYVRNPHLLIHEDNDHFENELKPFELEDALKIRDTKRIIDY